MPKIYYTIQRQIGSDRWTTVVFQIDSETVASKEVERLIAANPKGIYQIRRIEVKVTTIFDSSIGVSPVLNKLE